MDEILKGINSLLAVADKAINNDSSIYVKEMFNVVRTHLYHVRDLCIVKCKEEDAFRDENSTIKLRNKAFMEAVACCAINAESYGMKPVKTGLSEKVEELEQRITVLERGRKWSNNSKLAPSLYLSTLAKRSEWDAYNEDDRIFDAIRYFNAVLIRAARRGRKDFTFKCLPSWELKILAQNYEHEMLDNGITVKW